MRVSTVRQMPDEQEGTGGPGVPVLPWLTGGVLAGLFSGAMTVAVAMITSLAAGLPWHRPLNVIASLAYGPHLAVADNLRSEWLSTAAALAVAAMLASGLLYGMLTALLGFRPSRWLALKLGLLIGLSAWLIIVKAVAPVVSPLTVRLVPLWATMGLFTLFGAGLTAALPITALFTRLTAPPVNDAAIRPRRSSRVVPR